LDSSTVYRKVDIVDDNGNDQHYRFCQQSPLFFKVSFIIQLFLWQILIIFLLTIPPQRIYCDEIVIQSKLKVFQRKHHIRWVVDIDNKGETRSIDLSVTIYFFNKINTSNIIDHIDAGHSKTIHMNMDIPNLMAGAFPLVAEIKFHDTNSFPFYSLHCTNIYVNSQQFEETLSATVNDIHISDKQDIHVCIHNKELMHQWIHVKMFLSGAFSCDKMTHDILLNRATETISYPILIQAALPDTNHQGFVMITYVKDRINHSCITPFTIRVNSDKHTLFFSKRCLVKIYASFAIVCALIITMYCLKQGDYHFIAN